MKNFTDQFNDLLQAVEDLIATAEDEFSGEKRASAVAYLDDMQTDMRQFISELN